MTAERNNWPSPRIRGAITALGIDTTPPPTPLVSTGTCDLYTHVAGAGQADEQKIVIKVHREGIDRIVREGLVLKTLHSLGLPTPVLLASDEATDDEPAYLVTTFVDGRDGLQLLRFAFVALIATGLINQLLLGGMLSPLPLVLFAVMVYLPLDRMAGMLRTLHELPVTGARTALAGNGVDVDAITFGSAWLDDLAARAHASGQSDLSRGIDWLRRHEPAPASPVLCHGDYHFGNVLLSGYRVAGLIDWAEAVIVDREYDLAWQQVLGHFVATPAFDTRPVAALAGSLTRTVFIGALQLQLLLYRRGQYIDSSRMHYFRALHLLRTMIMMAETEQAGGSWTIDGMPERVRRAFVEHTGILITGSRT